MVTSVDSHFEHLVTYKNKSYFLVVPSKTVITDMNAVRTYETTNAISLLKSEDGGSSYVINSALVLDRYTGIITNNDATYTIEIPATAAVAAQPQNITSYLQITSGSSSENIKTTLQNLEEDAIDAGFDVDLPIDDYVLRTKIAPKLIDSNYIYSAPTSTIDNIIAVKIDKIEPSSDNVIAVKISATSNKLFVDTDDNTDSSANNFKLYHEEINIASSNAQYNFTHMIVVKNLNDNLLDSTLLSSSENKNTSLNQNAALKYILIILIVISLINMGINYNTINISHLIVFVLFLIYYYYYDYFSLYLLLKFKEAIYTSKKVNTTNQITSYLYILLLCCISLFFPIMVFSIFNTDFLNNDITDAGVGDAVESATSNVTSSFNSIKDMADDGFEQATSASDNLRNLNASDVSDSFKNAAGSTLKDGMNSANSLKDSYF